jgi:pantothenate synthetase
MSSRNNYLSTIEREKSQSFRETLLSYQHQIEQGSDFERAGSACVKSLQNHGFIVDYVTLRETEQLNEVSRKQLDSSDMPIEVVILAAVKLGSTRLIDNVKFIIQS